MLYASRWNRGLVTDEHQPSYKNTAWQADEIQIHQPQKLSGLPSVKICVTLWPILLFHRYVKQFQ
jgi:hypothetical protein